MKFVPHEYQQKAINFIKEHPVSAVLLDMGLGKTVITLTALNDLMFDSFDTSRVLVIAPLRVAKYTWPQEIKKWDHLKHLTCSVAVGTAKEREAALLREADIYVINRENVPWLEQSSLFKFDAVVIDELSSFKSYNSQRFKALMRERPKIDRVIGLTGTPASNGYMDLFAEYKVLDMGQRLGRFISHYRDAFFIPGARNGEIVYNYKLRPNADKEINQRVADITMSMKATDYLKMPDFISTKYTVTLSESERSQYERLKRDLILQLSDAEITAANATSLSIKLSQMANGAIYGDDGAPVEIHSRKLDALEDIIESMNGKPLLVAYWFKHDLSRIMQRLTERKIPFLKLDSEDSIQAWNAGKVVVGLIHPASAGHGLNLQDGGAAICWFGLTWSLELYQQTNARLWRQGQKAKTVVVTHIVTDGTIDQAMLAALKAKDKTQETFIAAVKAALRKDVL